MLVDMLLLSLLSAAVAWLLNKLFFNKAPASRVMAWTLSIGYWVISIFIASATKFFRYSEISKSTGVTISPQNPFDMGTAIIMAFIFFQVLNRVTKFRPAKDSHMDSPTPAIIGLTDTPTRNSSTKTTHANSPVSTSQLPPCQKQAAMSSNLASNPATEGPTAILDQDAIYTAVAEEMETGKTDKGLWTRLYAEFDGDEKRTKIAYIKQRAEKLISLERTRAADEQRQRQFESRREEIAIIGRKLQIAELSEERLMQIRDLAIEHSTNHRMRIDQQAQLLALAGGRFAWVGSSGNCVATFMGRDETFEYGKLFSDWMLSQVVPYLLENIRPRA